MATDRRAELDKAYKALSETLFSTIERVAREHPKTPPDVIKFGELCDSHRMVKVVTHINVWGKV